jgi:hypothetical protein
MPHSGTTGFSRSRWPAHDPDDHSYCADDPTTCRSQSPRGISGKPGSRLDAATLCVRRILSRAGSCAAAPADQSMQSTVSRSTVRIGDFTRADEFVVAITRFVLAMRIASGALGKQGAMGIT